MNPKVQILSDELIVTVQNDENIIGLFSTGSCGKGMITEESDYDVTVIVKDAAADVYQAKFKGYGGVLCDLSVKTLDDLKEAAAWGGPTSWDRYNYTHLKAEVDKTGEIQKLINEKGTIPLDKIEEFVSSALDAYINNVYRSVKCFRDGNLIASQFEAAESVPSLLTAVFGLEGRVKPFNKYLDWELSNFPLKKLPWPKDDFISLILKITQTGDVPTRQMVLQTVEKVFRQEGYNQIFDSWEEMLPWMEEFK